jgi:hypothetical protein
MNTYPLRPHSNPHRRFQIRKVYFCQLVVWDVAHHTTLVLDGTCEDAILSRSALVELPSGEICLTERLWALRLYRWVPSTFAAPVPPSTAP